MGDKQTHSGASVRRDDDADSVTRATLVTESRNHRRRYVLYYLQNHVNPVPLDALVEQVAAWENDTTPDEITSLQRKSVYTALHQHHLPALEDAGLVTYDSGRKQVARTVETSRFELEFATDLQTAVEWPWLYLLMSLAGIVLLAGTWLGSSALGPLSALTVAGLVVGGFGVVSLCYVWDVVRWKRRADGMPPDIHFSRDGDSTVKET